MFTEPGLTVITHNVGYSEVIAGYASRKWHATTLAKYRVVADGKTRQECLHRHDAIVQKLYRLGKNSKVLPFLKSQPDVEIIK